MKVWIVQLAYRQDYAVHGVFATKQLAELACEAYNVSLGNQRNNPSWTAEYFEAQVIGTDVL